MPYMQPIYFRTRLPRPALLEFLAMAPAGSYAFLALPEGTLYGIFSDGDVLEYFCNEFLVQEFTIATPAELAAAKRQPGTRIWGETGLLEDVE